MQIRSLTLREIHLKLLAPFETSMDRVTERRILLAELNLDSASGWGECTAGENPFYSPEDTQTCWHILTTYLWPMLKGKHIQSAADVWPLLEHVRGHNMAKATLETYSLMMIEQPLGWDDLFGHVAIQKNLQTPICLDECSHTYEQAEAANSLGACKIINVKLGRVGGHLQAKRIHDLCAKNSIPVWCGGMLESGVGRAHNIAMSTQQNFSLPGDVSASARYWEKDIITPEVTVSPQGTIALPTTPGIGFLPNLKRIDTLTTRKLHLT